MFNAYLKPPELSAACGLQSYAAAGIAIRRHEVKLKSLPIENRRLKTALQMLYVKM